MKQTIFILLVETFILYRWLCLVYARRKTARAKAAEKEKYAIWDAAYSQALKADKGQYHAITQAIRAVRAAGHTHSRHGMMPITKL